MSNARTEITQERIIKELVRLAFLDIRKAFNPSGTMKPLHAMDDDMAAAPAGLDAIELLDDGAPRSSRQPMACRLFLFDDVRPNASEWLSSGGVLGGIEEEYFRK